MKKWPFFVAALVGVALFAGYLIGRTGYDSNLLPRFTGGGWGQMMGGQRYNQNYQMVSSAGVVKKVEDALKNAKIDKAKNTITYHGREVQLVVQSGSGQADGKFAIGGLVNPTIHVPKDANVFLELVNKDEDVAHGIEVTNAQPPYGQMPMMDGGVLTHAVISPLPNALNNQYPTGQINFQANRSGLYYYICQYPGHAAKGMYGKIIFE